jgi:YbbR domain-containing protein
MPPNENTFFQTLRRNTTRWLRVIAHFLFYTLGLRFLLALISAFALWWFVVSSPNTQSANSAIGNYRTVQIVVQRTGNPADGYAVTSVQVTPPTITIQGAAPTLVNVDYVNTQPVDITGKRTTVTQVVPLDLPPGTSSTSLSAVTVSIYIAPVVGSISAQAPVTVKNLGANLAEVVTPGSVTVSVTGPLPRLTGLTIEPTVDVSGRGPGTYLLPVQVSAPTDVTMQVSPAEVTVTLTPIG